MNFFRIHIFAGNRDFRVFIHFSNWKLNYNIVFPHKDTDLTADPQGKYTVDGWTHSGQTPDAVNQSKTLKEISHFCILSDMNVMSNEFVELNIERKMHTNNAKRVIQVSCDHMLTISGPNLVGLDHIFIYTPVNGGWCHSENIKKIDIETVSHFPSHVLQCHFVSLDMKFLCAGFANSNVNPW